MRVGIIGAMESEVAYLREQLSDVEVVRCMGMEFALGTLAGVPVAVVRCGIGKVNAALCAQALILRLGATCVINTGTAGSLDASIDIGDIVVSTQAVQHDFDVRGLGYSLGEIPDMGGMCLFPTDAALRERMVRAIAAVAPEVRPHEGVVASGDTFVSSPDKKDLIVREFGALCCEMEGAAVVQACYLAQMPCVVVRAISDKADGSAHMDYRSFEAQAAERGARIVAAAVADMR